MLRSVCALGLVNVALVAPVWLRTETLPGRWIAVEALVVVGVLTLLPRRRWSAAVSLLVAALVVGLSFLSFGDAAARESLARPLNLYLDLHLLDAVRNLVTGAVGPAAGFLLLPLLSVTALVAVVLLAVLLAPHRAPGPGRRWAGALLLVGGILLSAGDSLGRPTPGTGAPGVRVAHEQVNQFLRMMEERARFAGELAASRSSYGDLPGLLGRLEGRDVVLAFVESYGVSALADPRYAPVVRPRVEELGHRVEAAGLHMATGTLVSPTQGGQSWFAHGSLLSGLWLDNQLRYDLLLTSGRETLVDDFRRAGHRTVALMPAITLAWPEGEVFGYDAILAYRDIGYAGPPLNWVTMPDQFTWSYLQRVVREDTDPRPVFAEVGLISSHAPWTPILTVLEDWDSIGDGSVFAPWENAGERPVELWRDHDRVREHYALSLDYALAAMTGYAERYVDGATLLIVMGDHQPAPLITGEEAGRAVPVHVISGDPALVAPFLEWGFAPGALPPGEDPGIRMDAFRDWFVGAYSLPGTRPPVSVARAESDS
jgi:hypothetical protein